MTDTAAPFLIVAGPTASGKSSLAADAAEAFDGTVINADSMQVYRDLRVLTARPSADDEARVPHRLYGVLDAADPCSVGRWLGMAREAVDATRAEGRLPIVAGGTGLYLKALTEGIADLPEVPAAVRAEATERLHHLGGEAFRAELAEMDAETARRLRSTDSQRLIRAWEVARATGRPLSDWQQAPQVPPVAGRAAWLVVLPPRETLYALINARFRAMLEAGGLDEVRALDARGLDPALPAMKAVGVPELRRYLAGTWSLDQAVDKAAQATRNYAKRQLTWLRHQVSADHVLNAQYSESLKEETFSFIRRFLLTAGK